MSNRTRTRSRRQKAIRSTLDRISLEYVDLLTELEVVSDRATPLDPGDPRRTAIDVRSLGDSLQILAANLHRIAGQLDAIGVVTEAPNH